MPLLNHGRCAAAAAACAIAVGVAIFRAATPAAAAPPAALAAPEAVYAAFTINLTRFVTWPEAALGAPDAPMVIGTFPRDPINDELDAAVAGESIGGRPLRTMRIRSLNDLTKCHVVFVSRGVTDPAAVLSRLERRPVLTISDADGFIALGGHVRFVPNPPHTRLQISAANLKACGLEARSQLLRLAGNP